MPYNSGQRSALASVHALGVVKNMILCRKALLPFLALIVFAARGDDAVFYDNPELQKISIELDSWCSDRADCDLLISFHIYGHPWSPSAVRIMLSDTTTTNHDDLNRAAHNLGIIQTITFYWNKETDAYQNEEREYELSEAEIDRIEQAIYRSEIFGLSERDRIVDGTDKLVLRDFRFAIDPKTIVARAINHEKEIRIERLSSTSQPMDYAIGEIYKLLTEKSSQPSSGGNER